MYIEGIPDRVVMTLLSVFIISAAYAGGYEHGARAMIERYIRARRPIPGDEPFNVMDVRRGD